MPYKYVKSAPKKTKKPKTKVGTYVKVAPVEVKFFDSVFPTAGIPAGPASLIDSTLVAEIQNGTGPQSRVGRKIKVVQVDYSLTVFLNGAIAGTQSDAFRYDIWLDRQSNGAAPSPAVLYTAVAGALGTTQMPNLFNEKRFKRLFTRVVQLNLATGIGAANPGANVAHKFEGSFKPNCIIEYDDTTGNITDLTSNNLFQCWSSDIGVCQAQQSFCRIHYTDA